MILAAAFAAQASAQCNPALLFDPPLSFQASSAGSVTIVAADFNGDGIMDIATEANSGAGFVSVMLGTSTGGFGSPTLFQVNLARPTGLCVGDVNKDGFMDIVCGNIEGANLALLRGAGDGTFAPVASIPLAVPYTFSTQLGDFNEDGNLDVVTGDADNDRALVLLGAGNGSFATSPIIVPAGDVPFYVNTGDVDGDGHLDIIASSDFGDNVAVARGNGAGQFFARRLFATGLDPQRAVVADVNADGVADIVAANASSNNVSVLLGIDGLTYQAQRTFAAGSTPRNVRVADLTGDGNLDIVVTNANSDDVSVLVGNGNGTFRPQVRFLANDRPEDGEVFDANGDGSLDFIVTNGFSRDITPLLNTCTTSIRFLTQPIGGVADVGQAFTLSALVSAPGTLAYEWLVNGEPVVPGSDLVGLGTPTLTFDPFGPGRTGTYQLRASTASDVANSQSATISAVISCLVDITGDGTVDSGDLQVFISGFLAGCP